MSIGEAGQKTIPAYVSFDTFLSFVGSLKDSIVPQHIDRGMMDGMAGGVQSHLLSALRFLGLVHGKDDAVREEFRQLVAAHGTSEWKPALDATLKSAYSDVSDEVDISNTTDRKLRDAFKKAFSVEKSMLDRAVRFYVRGMREAGIPVSPHVGKRRPRGSGARKNGPPKERNKLRDTVPPSVPNSTIDAQRTVDTPSGMIDFPIPMGDKTGFIRIRSDLTMEHYPLVEAMLNTVKVLAETNSGRANA
ncbi:MAG: hypothetical protein WD069_22850 [Planctomycetales bacterium]